MLLRVVLTCLSLFVGLLQTTECAEPPQPDRRTRPSGRATDRMQLRRTPVVDVFDRCKNSVVNISTTQIIEMRSPFGDFDRLFEDLFEFPTMPRQPQRYKSSAVGSGFVIHSAGYIVTNAHVVARTAERKVIFADKRQLDAQVVGMDTSHDLAILKVESDRPLVPLQFGRSDDLLVGETVIAIGNPLGLQNTVTTGVISALDRTLELGRSAAYSGLIQTDAPINPGNSGGPLLNILGELIGVNTAIRGDAQNIGFAIPVEQLSKTLPAMLDIERRYRITTGLVLGDRSPPTIASVAPDSPAQAAGLQPEDTIVTVDNSPVEKPVDVHIALIGRNANERVALVCTRGGREFRTALVLAEKPRPDSHRLVRERLGVDVQAMTAAVARKLGLRGGEGVYVTRVEPDGPAASAEIEAADVLLAINGRAVSSLDDLGLVLETIEAGARLHLTFLRVSPRAIFKFVREVVAR